jgi:hypothetical protein
MAILLVFGRPEVVMPKIVVRRYMCRSFRFGSADRARPDWLPESTRR